MQTMEDLAFLSGVLNELRIDPSFQNPIAILRCLRIIQLLNEEALGQSEPLENTEAIHHRYQERYVDDEPPSKKRIEAIVDVLIHQEWLGKQSDQLKMRERGKRLMGALIRVANESLTHYSLHDRERSSEEQKQRTSAISPNKIQTYITQMFDPPSDRQDVHEIFSFMEQNKYPGEAMDGLWVPVKVASPLSPIAIDDALTYLETYEPIVDSTTPNVKTMEYVAKEIADDNIATVMKEVDEFFTSSMIEPASLAPHVQTNEQVDVEELVISSAWGEAIAGLTAVAAQEGIEKIKLKKSHTGHEQNYEKEWEWANDGDGEYNIRKHKIDE